MNRSVVWQEAQQTSAEEAGEWAGMRGDNAYIDTKQKIYVERQKNTMHTATRAHPRAQPTSHDRRTRGCEPRTHILNTHDAHARTRTHTHAHSRTHAPDDFWTLAVEVHAATAKPIHDGLVSAKEALQVLDA